jgi:hypothetical protein
MLRRTALLLLTALPAAGQAAGKVIKFTRPRVPVPLFTHEHTALLAPECTRIAVDLARRAARQCSEGVLRGDPAAVGQARLWLTVSLHLEPLNASAVHCITRWLDGQPPALAPAEENLRVFTGFLLAAAAREHAKEGSHQPLLARVLRRLAADLDPRNEDAVLASELQDRDGLAPPLQALLRGTLTVPVR